jgi:plastocyanin
VGDTVEWKNDGIVPHTATADGAAKSLLSISGTTCKGARGAMSHARKHVQLYLHIPPEDEA